MNNKKIADRIGYRFYILMALSETFEEEFVKNLNVPIDKINSYKSGLIDEADVGSIVEFFKRKRVNCTSDWLLYGLGTPPEVVNSPVFNDFVDSSSKKPEDIVSKITYALDDIKKELSFFLNLHPEAKFLYLREDFLESNFLAGDIVAGIFAQKPLKNDYILFDVDNQLTIGKLLTKHLGRSEILLSNRSIIDIELKDVAKIIWHRSYNKSIYNHPICNNKNAYFYSI